MPYPNEHACRLVDPKDVEVVGSGERKHNSKTYRVIFAKPKGDPKAGSLEQAYRYPKETWTEPEARAHCEGHHGIMFEPASEQTASENRLHYCIDKVVFDGNAAVEKDGILTKFTVFTKEGVQNRALKPREELKGSEKWLEHRPIVIEHPEGWPLRHQSPTGFTSDLKFREEDAAIVGLSNFWIDKTPPCILKGIKAGTIREGSVGYWAQHEFNPGTFEGQPYTHIERNLIYEHYAILTGEKGACPCSQGCGLQDEINGAIAPHETPKADEDTPWNFNAAEYDVDQLKRACAWYDEEHPDVKGAYKLAHHLPDGRVVWRGVAAAGAVLMGARGGVDIPQSDIPGVKKHLATHYRQFEKTPPWESSSQNSQERPKGLTNQAQKGEKGEKSMSEKPKDTPKTAEELEAELNALKTEQEKIVDERVRQFKADFEAKKNELAAKEQELTKVKGERDALLAKMGAMVQAEKQRLETAKNHLIAEIVAQTGEAPDTYTGWDVAQLQKLNEVLKSNQVDRFAKTPRSPSANFEAPQPTLGSPLDPRTAKQWKEQ